MILEILLGSLISYKSITPHDVGCQVYMAELLKDMGFKIERFDNPPVSNFIATIGSGKPFLLFAGHTDVVSAGNIDKWHTDPFKLTEKNGMYYGRGVADMKGSLAAMLIAAERFIKENPDFKGRLGFLITSAEEGDFYNQGTPFVMEKLKAQNLIPDFCIVGEPSSNKMLADTIKIGRRGSLNAKVKIPGIQGHVAYPKLAENPIHKIIPALNELVSHSWDNGNEFFPPTSFQISYLEAGEKVHNVIPGELNFYFNFRYSNELTAEDLQLTVQKVFEKHNVKSEINWILSGKPFLTKPGRLIESTIKVIENNLNLRPHLSTDGGTSDGRFIAPYGVEVVELGPVNNTIHQVNEAVAVNDLNKLQDLYYELCKDLLN